MMLLMSQSMGNVGETEAFSDAAVGNAQMIVYDASVEDLSTLVTEVYDFCAPPDRRSEILTVIRSNPVARDRKKHKAYKYIGVLSVQMFYALSVLTGTFYPRWSFVFSLMFFFEAISIKASIRVRSCSVSEGE